MISPNSNIVTSLDPKYIIKHSKDPIHWKTWTEETLQQALDQDKPIFLTIGYSACHWCDVMHRECFLDKKIAALLNSEFISIIVDREQRPDIDKIYMKALQQMGVVAGWPLNIFLMPDQKPFFGGTYFSKTVFYNIISDISHAYKKNKKHLQDSSRLFANSINLHEENNTSEEQVIISSESDHHIYHKIEQSLDDINGGLLGAPKFPISSIGHYLLTYYKKYKSDNALKQLILFLDSLALKGIYDSIGGGFFRYCTDEEWHIPHFEKMLYDNSLIVALFSQVCYFLENHKATNTKFFSKISVQERIDLYHTVIDKTLDFISSNLKSKKGGYYSSLDAHSDQGEGYYYLWRKKELDAILTKNKDDFYKYYSITEEGNCINGSNLLYVTNPYNNLDLLDSSISTKDDKLCSDLNMKLKIQDFSKIFSELEKERSKRKSPGIDDKIILSWNAMLVIALVKAYKLSNAPQNNKNTTESTRSHQNKYKSQAIDLISYLIENHIYKNQVLRTIENHIEGTLEDYAWFIKALINIYEITYDEKYILLAEKLQVWSIERFYCYKQYFFEYSDQKKNKLIASYLDIYDADIPSSNTIMAGNLHVLYQVFQNQLFRGIKKKMKRIIYQKSYHDPIHYMSWTDLILSSSNRRTLVAIIGDRASKWAIEIQKLFFDEIIVIAATDHSKLPVFKEKYKKGTTLGYICTDRHCYEPISDLDILKERISHVI